MTCMDSDVRFGKHKAGIQANSYAQRKKLEGIGVRLQLTTTDICRKWGLTPFNSYLAWQESLQLLALLVEPEIPG